MDYIISDTHFNHKNIGGLCGFVIGRRRFPTPQAMNDELITNFNRVVGPDDHTYHLGDIALQSSFETILQLLLRLNGRFTFILGNHDSPKLFNYLRKHNRRLPNGHFKFSFEDVGVRVKSHKKTYLLTHFPMTLGSRRSNYRNLCGHIHENVADEPNAINVGIDSPELPKRPFGAPVPLSVAMRCVDDKWKKWHAQQNFDKGGRS